MTLKVETVTEPAFVPEIDEPRTLPNQDKILRLMIDGQWRTYREIGASTGLPAETIGSHLRNLRMDKGGGYVLCRRPRLHREAGLYEYQLLEPGSVSEYDSAKEPKREGKAFYAGFKHAVRIAAEADRGGAATKALIAEVKRYLSLAKGT